MIKSVSVDVLGTLENEHIFMFVSTKCSSDLEACQVLALSSVEGYMHKLSPKKRDNSM